MGGNKVVDIYLKVCYSKSIKVYWLAYFSKPFYQFLLLHGIISKESESIMLINASQYIFIKNLKGVLCNG